MAAGVVPFLGRFDHFVKPSADDRFLRTGDGRSRRRPVIPDWKVDVAVGRRARLQRSPPERPGVRAIAGFFNVVEPSEQIGLNLGHASIL